MANTDTMIEVPADEPIPEWTRWGADPEANMGDEPWTFADWEEMHRDEATYGPFGVAR